MTATATAVRERPILFSAEMVRALLAGTKTQTRRVVVKAQPPGDADVAIVAADGSGDVKFGRSVLGARGVVALTRWIPCPYGQPGDRLWVRESWQADMDLPAAARIRARWWHETPAAFRGLENVGYVYYKADNEALHAPHRDEESGEVLPASGRTTSPDTRQRVKRWLPSIHMPRWASRITLEITDVWVERVQDISEEDARAEGVAPLDLAGGTVNGKRILGGFVADPRLAFCTLWNAINGPRGYGWDANPWVWAVSFRRVAA